MRRMRWPQFAGPALHHHHQLTQIDPDWQRGILCFLRSLFPTPQKYLLHPKCTFLIPRKKNLSSHPNWPKLSKSLSFPANNKYLQLWFSTSILTEHISLHGSKPCKSSLKSKSWGKTKLLLRMMMNHVEQSQHQVSNQWECAQAAGGMSIKDLGCSWMQCS